jgi:ribosomal protein L7/L12
MEDKLSIKSLKGYKWVLHEGSPERNKKVIKAKLQCSTLESEEAYTLMLQDLGRIKVGEESELNIEVISSPEWIKEAVIELPVQLRLVEKGKRLAHIKKIKNHTGWGLKKSKEVSDYLLDMKEKFNAVNK